MEIKTKFNVGDGVWAVGLLLDKYEIVYGEITSIDIKINKTIEICYGSIGKFFIGEQNCFATKEEAQAECDRRNKV